MKKMLLMSFIFLNAFGMEESQVNSIKSLRSNAIIAAPTVAGLALTIKELKEYIIKRKNDVFLTKKLPEIWWYLPWQYKAYFAGLYGIEISLLSLRCGLYIYLGRSGSSMLNSYLA